MRNLGCGAACGWRVSDWRVVDRRINHRRIGNSGPSFALHAADGQHGPGAHGWHSSTADGQHHRAADWIYGAFESAGIQSDQSERKHDRTFNDESE